MLIRIPVTIHGVPEKFLIVSPTGEETVQWLCQTAYDRYKEKYFDRVVPVYFIARRMKDRCLLNQMDRVRDVLNDNESIQMGKRRKS